MAETHPTAPDDGDPDGYGEIAVEHPGAGHARYTPPRAPRTGQPWTDADYERILAAVREGVTDIDDVAARLGRTRQATVPKARRLLPVAERSAPVDRVLRLLREHQEDPGYDWQQVTLEEPPPRPVVHPPARTGIPGLGTDDLIMIAYALGLAGTAADDDVATRVAEEAQRRGLLGELLTYRTERLLRQPGAEVTRRQAESDADSWLQRTFPSLRGWPYAYRDDSPAYAYGDGSPPDW